MGQRSSTETVIAIVQAFLRQRTWSQAALAREVGVTVPAVRRRLLELEQSGMPLTRDEDHPHVYWSVPREWFPGGTVVTPADLAEILRQLFRAAKTSAGERVLQQLRQAAGAAGTWNALSSAVLTPPVSSAEDGFLSAVEDAVAHKVALRVQYFTASRGAVEWRHVSPQRITPPPAARFVAVCHRTGALKWFRVDNILSAAPDASVPFRAADDGELQALLSASVDGFHSGNSPVECAFVVRAPEARWVARNLPRGARVESTGDGLRVTLRTSAIRQVARFVVGLGGAARAETPSLAEHVHALARAALAEHSEQAFSHA